VGRRANLMRGGCVTNKENGNERRHRCQDGQMASQFRAGRKQRDPSERLKEGSSFKSRESEERASARHTFASKGVRAVAKKEGEGAFGQKAKDGGVAVRAADRMIHH